MWDTTGLPLKPFAGRQNYTGAPRSHQRTWDENDGRSPPQIFVPDPTGCSLGPERTRISYFALLATTTCAALREESRMQSLKATGLHRKSGEA